MVGCIFAVVACRLVGGVGAECHGGGGGEHGGKREGGWRVSGRMGGALCEMVAIVMAVTVVVVVGW